MTRPPRTPDDRWRDLMDGLADSAANAPDEDVIEEARDAHGDEARRAEAVRDAMLATVDEFEPGTGDRRVLPFVASAPEPRRAPWRLAATAAAAVVVGSLAFAALWRPGSQEVAVAPPPVVEALAPAPPLVTPHDDSARNPAPVEPTERPAPPEAGPRERPRPRDSRGGDTIPSTPSITRTLPSAPPVGLAKVKTVCVNLGLDTLSETAHALRDEITQKLGSGGLLTPVDNQDKADSRLRISEPSVGHFVFLFMADNQRVWEEPATIARPTDVKTAADHITDRVTSTVLDARQKAGASE